MKPDSNYEIGVTPNAVGRSAATSCRERFLAWCYLSDFFKTKKKFERRRKSI
jgi:hypothetical protein